MPRKAKFTEQDIINAAFAVIRENGASALSTRTIAKKMDASTMPVYSFMKSRQNLDDILVVKALDLLNEYQMQDRTGDLFINMGAGFVLFARKEKHLFNFIYDEKNVPAHQKHIRQMREYLVGVLRKYPLLAGLDDENIHDFLMLGITYSFGLAHLVNRGLYEKFNDEQLIALVRDSGRMVIEGYKKFRETGAEKMNFNFQKYP